MLLSASSSGFLGFLINRSGSFIDKCHVKLKSDLSHSVSEWFTSVLLFKNTTPIIKFIYEILVKKVNLLTGRTIYPSE